MPTLTESSHKPSTNDSELGRVLVVDDEKNMRRLLQDILTDEGWAVEVAASAEDALALLKKSDDFTALVVDLALPGMNGLELLQKATEAGHDVPAIVITAFGTVDMAVKAMKAGAVDFLVKPFDNARLKSALRKVRESGDLLRSASLMQPRVSKSERGDAIPGVEIIGSEARMGGVFRVIRQVASTRACVLILGESGTGKELVAQAIHFNSDRRDRPFVPINCAALPETLLESEFFGHERGSFTGAYALQRGHFELADGGTLFLDEVGDMPPALQVKLLRVLQDGRFTRVGGDKEISVDVRVIAATNRDLAEAVRNRTFREDLFYRLNIIPIQLPPLRERIEDIEPMIDTFMRRFSARHRLPPIAVPPATLEAMRHYAWPGNVRELKNCVEKAVVLQDPNALLPGRGGAASASVAFPGAGTGLSAGEDSLTIALPLGDETNEIRPLGDVAADAQRAAVIRALRLCDGNKAEAAKRLQISYKTLFNKLHDLGIQIQTSYE